jgi:hypothetical protein
MFRRKFLMAAIIAGIATLAGPATSEAGFQVSAVVGGNSATITDNNSANLSAGTTANVSDTDGSSGLITTPTVLPGVPSGSHFSVGGVEIGLTAFSSTSGSSALLSTTSNIVIFNNTAAAIVLVLTVSNEFTLPAGQDLILAQSLTIEKFFNGTTARPDDVPTSDSVFSVAHASLDATATGSLGSNTTGYNANNWVYFNRTSNPFSMDQTFTITLQANESVKFQGTAQVVPVPAPAGLILAATALPFASLLRRRLRRPEATTAA